jgi:RHS repeat-associated protein
MQTTVTSSGTTTYSWDFENRLSSVALSGSGGTVQFSYDPFGRRIKKSSSAGTSIFAYDGDNLSEEVNSSGAVVARYTQNLGIDEPLALLRSGITSYYHQDGLHSIGSLTSSAGAIANSYTYDSFGILLASTGSIVNSLQYTGREFDSETSLYYYRARYYDSQTGRFFSEDQKIPGRNPGWSNLYEYVENSSTNFADPYGRFTVKPGVPYPSLEIQALLECIEFKTLLSLQVTSTSDSHDPKDPHSRGLAVDIHYPGPMATDSILCAAAGCGAGFAQDEAMNPSPNATGPHIHLQIPPGRNGGRGDLPTPNCHSCER